MRYFSFLDECQGEAYSVTKKWGLNNLGGGQVVRAWD